MKKLLNITLVLMTLAFTSTVFAEIMEDIRVECKDLIPAAANTGAPKGTKNGSYVAKLIPKSKSFPPGTTALSS
jgi:hypothetical protein